MLPRDPMTPWRLWALMALVLIVLPIACQRAAAAPAAGVMFDCRELAESVAAFADFRDAGAELKRVLAMVRERVKGAPQSRIDVVVREITRLWTERLPREEAGFKLYKRCSAVLGDMGRES